MLTATYHEIRDRIAPGDVIAFGGSGHFSQLIKRVLSYPVSHVGVVYELGEDVERRVMVIESTSLYDQKGVQLNALSRHVENYDGELWWLPLSRDTRLRMDFERFVDFGRAHLGKPYDFRQAVGAAIDVKIGFPFWREQRELFEQDEDYSAFFCSEYVAAAYEYAHAIPPVNASEQTPADVIRWNLYHCAIQILGEPMEIPDLGTVELWGAP